MNAPALCQSVQCRNPRQDLQCQKAAGHAGRHYHGLAIGFCDPRWQSLTPNGGGHTAPRIDR